MQGQDCIVLTDYGDVHRVIANNAWQGGFCDGDGRSGRAITGVIYWMPYFPPTTKPEPAPQSAHAYGTVSELEQDMIDDQESEIRIGTTETMRAIKEARSGNCETFKSVAEALQSIRSEDE